MHFQCFISLSLEALKKYQLSNRFPWIREDFVATIVSEKNLYNEFIWFIYPGGTSILGWWPSWPIKNSWLTVMLRFCRFFDFADSPILAISEAVSDTKSGSQLNRIYIQLNEPKVGRYSDLSLIWSRLYSLGFFVNI